jgi:hypothetical protein
MNAKLRATTRSFLDSVGPIQLRMRTCPSELWRTTGQESSLTHNDPFIVMSLWCRSSKSWVSASIIISRMLCTAMAQNEVEYWTA